MCRDSGTENGSLEHTCSAAVAARDVRADKPGVLVVPPAKLQCDFAAHHAPAFECGLAAPVFLLAIAAWALYTSLGRPRFRTALLDT